jgi:membrane dipeptidase
MSDWIVDAHTDLLLELVYRREEEAPFGRLWLPHLQAGQVALQVCPIYLSWEQASERATRSALEQVVAWRRAAAENPDAVCVVRTAEDLVEVERGERIGLMLSLEGAEPLGNDPSLIDIFWELGVRMVGLTHFPRNAFADGNGEPAQGGLSAIGKELVLELQSRGAIIDLAHASDRTFTDVLETAPSAAVVVSHSACRALHHAARNVSDDQMRAVAARNGVVGIFAAPMMLGDDGRRIDRVVDHIVHALETAGPEHVGLGGDFITQLLTCPGLLRFPVRLGLDEDKVTQAVEGFSGPQDYPFLVAALRSRGVDGEVLDGVLRENFLRLFRRGLPG